MDHSQAPVLDAPAACHAKAGVGMVVPDAVDTEVKTVRVTAET